MSPDDAARDLYRRVIDGWNAGDAETMTAPMAADALGFDGSQLVGRDQIAAELGAGVGRRNERLHGVAVGHDLGGLGAPGRLRWSSRRPRSCTGVRS